MNLKEETLEVRSEFQLLEEKIINILNESPISSLEKEELLIKVLKNSAYARNNLVIQDFKLYPAEDGSEESNHQRYRTKDKRYSLIIAFDSFHTREWFFYAANDSNIKKTYNSLWEKKTYQTDEECIQAAELWLSELIE